MDFSARVEGRFGEEDVGGFLAGAENVVRFHTVNEEATVDGELRIRRFEEDDGFAVIDLWNECGLIVPWNHPQRDIERKLAEQRDGFLVGTLHGKVVASIMIGYDGHRGWVNYLAVSPQLRRRGVGRLMMEAAEGYLKRRGSPKISLQIRETNTEVIAFYEALGYKNDHVVSMGKRLEQDPPWK